MRKRPARISMMAVSASRSHPGHHPAEAVAGRLGQELLGGVGLLLLADEPGQRGAVDHPVPALGPHGLEAAFVAPAADRVRADAEELGQLTGPVLCHGGEAKPSTSQMSI